MNIIIVDNSLDITGAFKAGFSNVLHGNSAHEFLYFVPEGSKVVDWLRSRAITVYTFTSFELSRKLLNLLLYVPFLFWNGYKLSRIVKKHRVDTIYQNEIFILSGVVARQFANVNVITHIRVMPTVFPVPLFRLWLRLQDRFSDRILATSFVCAAAARDVYAVKQEIDVVYDFIPPAPTLPEYMVRECLEGGRLLFIGNYTRGKGHDLALQVASIILERHPGYRLKLLFVGSDFGYAANMKYRRSLMSYVRDNGLEATVQLGDFAPNIEEVMKCHDVLLNLSVAESFSWVVAEALYFGIPVVATDSGGPGELIESEVSGLLVPPDATTIADRIWELLQDRQRRTALSDSGKARIASLLCSYGSKEFS